MSCDCEAFHLSTPSEYSLRSKAQIDALFEDSRSLCSSSAIGPDWYHSRTTLTTATPNSDGGTVSSEEQRLINEAVQARIEAMFASVEAETGAQGENTAAALKVGKFINVLSR